MSKLKVQSVIRFMSLPAERCLPASFVRGSQREWQGVLDWLDSSGLALYFLRKLQSEGLTNAVPLHFLSQLERRQEANIQRISRMRCTFELLNRLFAGAGVQYAVLKGFSLVPEYCPDASLRAQSDLDYLIAPSSLDRARQIVLEQGYVLKKQTGQEFAFWIPSSDPCNFRAQYDPQAPYLIELHCAAQDELRPESICSRTVSLSRLETRVANGATFFVLPEEEVFLAQILHAFQHLMIAELRPSWLLEVGHFIESHREDPLIWDRLLRLIHSDEGTAQIAGVVIYLVSELFGLRGSPASPWMDRVNPLTRGWIDLYGRSMVLEGCPGPRTNLFPNGKLILFLRDALGRDGQSLRKLWWRSLVPARVRSVANSNKAKPALTTESCNKGRWWLVSRFLYHVGSNLRYLWELPRWMRIKRSAFARQAVPIPISPISISPDPHGRFPT